MKWVTVGFVLLFSFTLTAQDPRLTGIGLGSYASDISCDSLEIDLVDTLCIIGTGDIMLGTNYPSRSYLPPGVDCSPLLGPVHHVLQSGDLLFGNLEGVFCSHGGTPKKCKDTTRHWWLF